MNPAPSPSDSDSSADPPQGEVSPADGAAELSRRLSFLELTDDDAARLRELAPAMEAHLDEFVEHFYRHLFAFPETARHLQDKDRVERLKRAQRAHFESLLEAHWDDEFVDQRRRIGLAHAETGVEPEHFLGSYSQYAQFCFRRYIAQSGAASNEQVERLLSLLKAVFLDIGLTLDAYFAESTSRLQHALEMLWETNLELRQFAQLTSHDLKTPLATLANLCDEAVDEFGDQMPAEARQLVQSAAAQAFRLSKLIDELLAATVMPESTDDNEMVDASRVIRESLARLEKTMEKRGISVEIPDSLPRVWGNRVRLREAFYNLFANAAKFIEESPGKIHISCEAQDDCCTICVADNGPGIPPNELERIFGPFRRSSLAKEGSGTGLGLYFTRNLVERQGGRVWADSQVGEGSQFYVRLRSSPPPASD